MSAGPCIRPNGKAPCLQSAAPRIQVRAMDEVDKNMDATFLRATLQLLIELFASQRSRQFLILTPLDYATPLAALGVTPEEAKRRDIRFLRLRAPRDNASQAGASQAP